MPLTILNWLLALAPVVVILALMLGLHWGGSRAGAIGWLLAIGIAILFYGAKLPLLAYSQGKALLLTLDVMYIIWGALLMFHVVNEAGALQTIGDRISGLTSDRTLQALLFGWVFVSFIQGMGGFGVPVAVVSPLLVGIGFSPIQAVVMTSLGHGWAVNYGSLATSFQTLMAVTNLPGEVLAPDSAVLLGIACFVCGVLVAQVASGWRGLVRAFPAILILGTVMSLTQYWLATHGLWTLGATGAALLGMLASIGIAQLPMYRLHPQTSAPLPEAHSPESKPRSLAIALSAYAILIVLAFSINLIEPVNDLFNSIKLIIHFPELSTSIGWITPAENGRAISLFGHSGAILLYTSIIAFVIYSRLGYYKPDASRTILHKVVKGGLNSSIGIAAMVGMAVVMSHAGMTNMLARGLSAGVGAAAYPAVAPFIGALGAFITGSNNNSNAVFALLQKETAQLLGLSVTLILGAQTAGGSLGSVLAPAKVIVGCTTVGLTGQEGGVIQKMLIYGAVLIGAVSVAALVMAHFL